MLALGTTGVFSKTVTETDIYLFAGITGDLNPLHINEEEAKQSQFNSRIAHGMLIGGYVSAVLGMVMPEFGTITLEQNMVFKKPVYINDTVTARATVIEIINPEKGIYKVDTTVVNNKNEIVVEGYAIVKI